MVEVLLAQIRTGQMVGERVHRQSVTAIKTESQPISVGRVREDRIHIVAAYTFRLPAWLGASPTSHAGWTNIHYTPRYSQTAACRHRNVKHCRRQV